MDIFLKENKAQMNEIFLNTPTAAMQLFIIVRKSDRENSIIKPLCKFKLQTMV